MAKIVTLEVTDSDDKVIGHIDQFSHLRRVYTPKGQFELTDGRRYNLRYVPKYYRNLRYDVAS